jgi:flagellar biosynthetic protein FlhB
MGVFSDNSGKTEKATAKRRGEARSKGQIGRSPSLTAAVVFLGVFFVLGTSAPWIAHRLSAMLHRVLSEGVPRELTAEGLQKMFLACAMDIWDIIFAVAATAVVLGIGSNVAQGGLIFSGHRLAFHFSNLNPATGLKRLLPGTAAGEMFKSVISIACIAYAAYAVGGESLEKVSRFTLMPPSGISSSIAELVYKFAMKCGYFLLVIGAADYFWNRRKFEQSIKMSKEEVKDEAKNAEGNPEIKSRIRRKQREIALRSMMADVPKADVVITNPTHYAVALQYRPNDMAAPTVVAKGKGYVALKIREIAEQNGVPLVENKPLAHSLIKAVDVGQQIPAGLFKAVAEVLAYVYKLRVMRP